jgi:protein ImuB
MLALWLPHLPTDRVWREAARHAPSGGSRAHALALSPPLVLFDEARGGLRLAAVDRPAAALGLAPGLPLADARARVPELTALAADRVADGNLLARLARWATRYTPHAATDGEDGLMLDITGAAHLLGGEAALRRDLLARLARLGFTARAAIADTPGAAWALARFAPREAGRAIAGAGRGATQAALADLPAAALRLGPATLDTLARLGVRRVADLARLPRHGLAARFADEVGARLDQAFGARPEPISPLRPAETWTATLAFAEPIATAEAIAHALDRLLAQLCARLSLAASGARRLDFACRRVDGTTTGCAIATSAPTRDPQRLARLFAERLETIAPGFGIESATLRARVVETLAPSQIALASGMPREGTDASETGDLAALVDRLANRLGPEAVTRLDLTTRHAPEAAQRASRDVAAATTREPPRAWRSPWTQAPTRPLRLLPAPEPIEVTAAIPDGPPLVFRWRRARHRVRRAEGPERLAAEWWLVYEHRRAVAAGDAASGPPPVAATRDYYRVEIEDGRRFWLFRLGLWSAGDAAPRWFVHGVFA